MRRVSISLAGVIVLAALGQAFVTSTATPQSKEQFAVPDLQSLKSTLGSQAKSVELGETIPVDAPLNAGEYLVGPGDRLGLNVWSSSPVEKIMTVTPEGSLIVPGVGIVDVRDLTLAQVKSKVGELVRRKYVNAEVSVSLLVPRKVSVTIIGQVLNEGKKNVYASQRVEDLIAMGNEFPTGRMDANEYGEQLNRLPADRSDRKIVIRRRNGEVKIADLARYRTSGEGKYNPYLNEGDIVYVPKRTDKDNTIGVFGGKLHRANFEFVDGDSLSTLIRMGLGFQTNADPTRALLTRLSPDGLRMDTITVDVLAVIEKRAPDIALRPGDRLVIPVTPVLAANYRVTLEGEVVRPGIYPIARWGTKLTEVVRLGGGLTADANLAGAVVYRNKADELSANLDPEHERLLGMRASIPVEDTSYYQVENALRLRGEVAAVDFRALFVEGDSTRDIILQPQDHIVIPRKQHTVFVFGQVLSPGHVMYASGQGYEHYIDRAGGYTVDALSGDVKIIKVGTRVWLDPNETHIEDGDMIWVPKKSVYPFSHYVTIWAQIAGIIGTVATVALLVNSLK